MKKSDLNGRTIKKQCNHLKNTDSVAQRYHNKNKSGGNFGFTVKILKPESEWTEGPLGGTKKHEWVADITGNYNTDGEITRLSLGEYGGVASEIPADLETLIDRLEKHIEQYSGFRPEEGADQ